MNLIELIKQNKSLTFIDAESGKNISVEHLLVSDIKLNPEKKLTFLYIDNSSNSISVLLNFLNSNHALALLSPQLNLTFKLELERIYSPYYIYDNTRTSIKGFFTRKLFGDIDVFENTRDLKYPISGQLKVLLSTSGTTGSPKFVKLSENNLIQNAQSILDYLPIKNNDVAPLNLPVFYSYGLSVLTTNCISGGSIICTKKDIINKEFWQDFEKFGYSSLAGVPYAYEMLLRIGFNKKQYSSLRYLTQAGGKLSERTVQIFAEYCKKYNIHFFIMYGQTEATARMSYLLPEYLPSKIGSIGKPIKNGVFEIDKETSELYYRGPNVFGGYANSVEELSTFYNSDFLKTGDIGKIDQDGFYFITGRLKRFIKIFGQRINLDDLERILKNEFINSNFVCTGLDDKKIFIGMDSQDYVPSEISAYIFDNLKLHPSVVIIKHLDRFPLTENGKIDYKYIYEKYKS